MATVTENVAAGIGLQVTKVIRAKRSRVFEAWTKPEVFRKWFGPPGKSVAIREMDMRVGGAYVIEMTDAGAPAKDPSKVWGMYREIVPDEKVQFTWMGHWTNGEETLVTVSLKDVEGGTLVSILHERFASEESKKGHEQGWTGAMSKLAEVLEA